MSLSYVAESRAYDMVYDTTYVGPFHQASTDNRVKMSSNTIVSGSSRYKYFRRPIMPRMNPVPPQVLLAPTAAIDPMIPTEVQPEPTLKTVEVQTMYRESEAQTNPYTPEYNVAEGHDPEILLLKDLTFENGLPIGNKEIKMIQMARSKKILENNLPPFTDEASLIFRKALMENQELKEFKVREDEIDSRREERLVTLQRILEERDESNEFLASQRVEAIRQTRMDEREKILQKIRNKRIKVLRGLANRRNKAEPLLHEGNPKDIVNEYFDKASVVYAPIKRLGHGLKAAADINSCDISTRTLPLNNMANILSLETVIPVKLLDAAEARDFAPNKVGDMMSKSAPAELRGIVPGGGRLTEDRMTSAARRDLRNTKRDLEEMHRILMKKNKEQAAAQQQGGAGQGGLAPGDRRGTLTLGTTSGNNTITGLVPTTTESNRPKSPILQPKKPKNGRPVTPDLVTDNSNANAKDIDGLKDGAGGDDKFEASIIFLQKLIRGRAVQNVMFEGKYRRRELIAELRHADIVAAAAEAAATTRSAAEVGLEQKKVRDLNIRNTTIEQVAGGAAVNVISMITNEQERLDLHSSLQYYATNALEERRKVEEIEAGRRQREDMKYPR